MEVNDCITILHVFISAALLCTVEVESSDECEDEILVRRHTAHEAVIGGNLIINCEVKFCNDSPPTVSWVKREQTDVAVDVSSNSRFKTEWKLLQPHDGVSYLIFRSIVSNDSGLYHCKSGLMSGHNIRVSVNGEVSECELDIIVPRNTEYQAVVGENLTINCTVKFCDSRSMKMSWFKRDRSGQSVEISGRSRFKTEWRPSSDFDGVLRLIFTHIVRNDSGLYQCRGSDQRVPGVQILGHYIRVTVKDPVDPSEGTWKTSEPLSPGTQNPLWPCLYRGVGVMAFVIILIIICVTSHYLRRGACAGGSRETSDWSRRPSPHAVTMEENYEKTE